MTGLIAKNDGIAPPGFEPGSSPVSQKVQRVKCLTTTPWGYKAIDIMINL